jgi:phosphomevalonate kinase
MRPIRASAPGKLVLSGEYAVLNGAPAICLAVNRRALATIASRAGDRHAVTAPGFSKSEALFSGGPGELSWHEGGDEFGLFEQVWRAAGMSTTESLSFKLDTRAFRENGTKIGAGSSAAIAVALATAMAAVSGGDAAGTARQAHREFQGGRGSGVDIAGSLAGGVIEYRIGDEEGSGLTWPEGLRHAVFWSGVAADTRGKLDYLQAHPAVAAQRALDEAAERFAAVFREGSVTQILDELGRYTAELRAFDAATGLGIFDAGHADLARAATAHGVVYKPCGAGGGDAGIALAVAEDSLASFTGVAETLGFRRLDVILDPQGAMLTEEEK